MSTTSYAPLVMWALGARDSSSPSGFTLARAVLPELVEAALTRPAIRKRLSTVPEGRRVAAVRALSVIARHRHIRHSYDVNIGRALGHLTQDSASLIVGTALGSNQPNATRILGNAITQAAKRTPINVIEFVTLLTDWDDLDLRSRSRALTVTSTSTTPEAP